MQNKDIYINNLKALEDFAKDLFSFFYDSHSKTADLKRSSLVEGLKSFKPIKKIIFLKGDLGSGKTTFSQIFLKILGFTGRVKSPTYTLIEPYEINGQKVYHLDLYRLQSDDELYHLGLSDLLNEEAIFLIEWPERLSSLGIKADLEIEFQLNSDYPEARQLRILS